MASFYVIAMVAATWRSLFPSLGASFEIASLRSQWHKRWLFIHRRLCHRW